MKKLINYLLLLLICCGCSDDVIDVFEMPQETSNVPQHDYYYYSNG
ncbi:unknown [Bacteroides sp. CAG:754]|nr:unknown [Bacteroides sp. CAG:754]